MRFFLLMLYFSAYTLSGASQNFILKDGEFMDTTNVRNLNCRSGEDPKFSFYYYQTDGKYPKSSNSVLKEVREFVKTKNTTYSGDGYITFRCRIDCEGRQNRKVQVLQTDQHYKPTHFEKGLVNDLFDFFRGLDKWKPAKAQRADSLFYYSYVAYMTFKIKNGKIINVIP